MLVALFPLVAVEVLLDLLMHLLGAHEHVELAVTVEILSATEKEARAWLDLRLWPLIQGRVECLDLPVSPDLEVGRIARLAAPDQGAQVPGVGYVRAVEAGQDVTHLETRAGGGAVLDDVGDQNSAAPGNPKMCAEWFVQVNEFDSEIGAAKSREVKGYSVNEAIVAFPCGRLLDLQPQCLTVLGVLKLSNFVWPEEQDTGLGPFLLLGILRGRGWAEHENSRRGETRH